MIECFFTDDVTLRRSTGRTARNDVSYEEVKTSNDAPLRLRCKIERTARRIYTKGNKETNKDATLIFKLSDYPELRAEDLVVERDGTVYKVISIDEDKQFGTGVTFARAALSMTRKEVIADIGAPDAG